MDLRGVLAVCVLWYSVESVVDKPIVFAVDEERPNGTLVGRLVDTPELRSRHVQETLDKFRFKLAEGTTVPFAISAVGGEIRTTEKIDREALCEQQRSCTVSLKVIVQPIEHFAVYKVDVEIVDTNDHRPAFDEPQTTLQISETAPPGSKYPLPVARDGDSRPLAVTSYVLVSRSQKFELVTYNLSGGELGASLQLTAKLDYEEERAYLVKVVAVDGGRPARSSALDVTITVLDHNDNQPVFTRPVYTAEVREDVSVPRLVLRVHADDGDSGDNGRVTYAFSPLTLAAEGARFSLDRDTGAVFVVAPLDYETRRQHVLHVIAADLGPGARSIPATVRVTVIDVNDHAPQLTISTVSDSARAEVRENQRAGQFVAHVAVDDADAGVNGECWCSLTGGASDFRLLQLSAGTYKLVTTTVMDRESRGDYEVQLTCRDRGDPVMTSHLVVPVTVVDENDNSPTLGRRHYAVTVREDVALGDVLLRLNASDADIGPNARLTYALVRRDQPLPDEPITVDADSGVVSVTRPLDHETRSHHAFLVIVSDRGMTPRNTSATLNVTVLDVNDVAPHFPTIYSFRVVENAPPMTYIGSVLAIDEDTTQFARITYSLDPADDLERDSFTVGAEDGRITAVRSLDREARPLYHLRVIARNRGHARMMSVAVVTVRVLDVNDNRPLVIYPAQRNRSVSVSSGAAVGDVIARIEASDPDEGENATLRYTITNGNDDAYFGVDGATGAVGVARALSAFAYRRFHLVLVVSDGGVVPLSVIVDLDVIVNKSLAAPLAASDRASSFTVLIGAACGAILLVLVIAVAILVFRWQRRRQRKREKRFVTTPAVAITTQGDGSGVTTLATHPPPPPHRDYHGYDDDGDEADDNDSSDSKQCIMEHEPPCVVAKKCYVEDIPHMWVQHPPQTHPQQSPPSSVALPETTSSEKEAVRGRHPAPSYPAAPPYKYTLHYPAEPPVHSKHARLPYPTRSFELVEMLDSSQNGDRGSETGSADSGRGVSEEGDHCSQRHLDSLLATDECRGVGGSQSDTSLSSADVKTSSSSRPPLGPPARHRAVADANSLLARRSSFQTALDGTIDPFDAGWEEEGRPPVPPSPVGYPDPQRGAVGAGRKKKVQFAATTTTFAPSEASSSADGLSEEDGTTTSGSYAVGDDDDDGAGNDMCEDMDEDDVEGCLQFTDYSTQDTVV